MAISDLDGRIRVAAFEFLAEQTRDPRHPDNAGLRLAMQRQTPLIYLYGLVPGRYLPVWPVYIVGDDPQTLAFEVAVDDARLLHLGPRIEETLETEARRKYVTRYTRQRLHQQSFRQRVLAAYQECCAICLQTPPRRVRRTSPRHQPGPRGSRGVRHSR